MQKKWGLGTLSMVLLILAFLFSVKIGRTFCLGDIILNSLGKPVLWGRRINIYVSALLLAAGYLLGKKYPDNDGAELGSKLCGVLGIAAVAIIIGSLMGVDLLYPLYDFSGK
jgi:hypothetical protein